MPLSDHDLQIKGGDAYAELLRRSRALTSKQSIDRERWYESLAIEGKAETLFELDVLLKSLGCFGNPRNHPGAPPRTAVSSQDFREQTHLARQGLARIVTLCRKLQPEPGRGLVLPRYLETSLPDGSSVPRKTRQARAQESPEDSLAVLRHGVTSVVELATAVVRLPRVPYRLFFSLLRAGQREVLDSTYFNALRGLEFRPEFDAIDNARVLELLRGVAVPEGRRIVALAFLALFRMLRYVGLAESCVRGGEDEARRPPGLAYLVLSVLRSDARALGHHLRRYGGPALGDGFARGVLSVPAREIEGRYDALQSEGQRLLEIKATLDGIGANLRLELRRAFEHEYPSPELVPTPDALRAATTQLASTLRPALRSAILVLGKSLGVRLDEHGLFEDVVVRRSLSEKLRRDVWMFAQIVRAFSQKARAASTGAGERWSDGASAEFVREFLAYFRAMGYPLLRAADYPRFDAYLLAMATLGEGDALHPSGLKDAIAECDRFVEYLSTLFERIGQRGELVDIPFDRRAAAGALKLYLGD